MTESALPPPYGLTAAAPGGKPPEGHSFWCVKAVSGEGLVPCFLICLSPCKVYLRNVAGP